MNYDNLTTVADTAYELYSVAYETYSVAFDAANDAQTNLHIANGVFDAAMIHYHISDQEWIDADNNINITSNAYDNANDICIASVIARDDAWNDVIIARENNIKNVERLINEENDLQKNVLNVIEIHDILRPLVKEKYIVAKILNMKYDMEMANLRKELIYLTEKDAGDDEDAEDSE